MKIVCYFRRHEWDQERASEVESYLAHEIGDNLARGMTEEARRQAHIRLDNSALIREEIVRWGSDCQSRTPCDAAGSIAW